MTKVSRQWVPSKPEHRRVVDQFEIELRAEGYWVENPLQVWTIIAKDGWNFVDSIAYTTRQDADTAWELYKLWPERAVAMRALNMKVSLS